MQTYIVHLKTAIEVEAESEEHAEQIARELAASEPERFTATVESDD